MNGKIKKIICQLFDAIILAGIIICPVGMYYWVVKAGIPYQDPTLEMQIKYAINEGIGTELLKTGFIVGVLGVVGRLVMLIVCRNPAKKND